MKNQTGTGRLARAAVFTYGAVAYAAFGATFCYAMGFVANMMVPKSIDSGTPGAFWPSVAINVALLGLFGLQHSVMARPEFKQWWTKFVPKPIERSTFVLATCVAFVLLFWQWRPMPAQIWNVTDPIAGMAMNSLLFGGFAFVFVATIMIHHFDLFGMRQVYTFARGERYRELGFRTPGVYKYLRHPIMVGFLVAFWVTPTMTVGHLLFSLVSTAYILVAVQIEERDLVRFHGEAYEDYRRKVGGLIPKGPYTPRVPETATTTAAAK